MPRRRHGRALPPRQRAHIRLVDRSLRPRDLVRRAADAFNVAAGRGAHRLSRHRRADLCRRRSSRPFLVLSRAGQRDHLAAFRRDRGGGGGRHFGARSRRSSPNVRRGGRCSHERGRRIELQRIGGAAIPSARRRRGQPAALPLWARGQLASSSRLGAKCGPAAPRPFTP